MKAVVLGGNGFIGSHLVDTLLANNWQIVVYDRSYELYRPPLANVEYVIGDLGNKRLLGSILPRTDVVFHLISTTIPQSSTESPLFDIQTNLVDTVQLLELCVDNRVGRIVFLSSGGTVYGVPQSLPVTEEHSTNPISAYGIVKLAIEKYLHYFNHLYGLPYMILRPSNPYGRRQNPLGHQGAIVAFLGRIAQGQPVTVWGDGEIVRDYFHVSDLAEACLRAATSVTDKIVLNIGTGDGTTLNQLLEIIKNVIQMPITIVRMPERRFDVPKLVLDAHAARVELNWTPKIQIEDGILDTWQWIKQLNWLGPLA